jgi:uncharacterized SAM-binding protein YcdF (DUF218 family)
MRGLISYGFLAPPIVFILIALLGAVLALVWKRVGFTIVLISLICLFVAATPAFSSFLTNWLESDIPNEVDFSTAKAIVVIGADVRSGYEPRSEQLGLQSLERIYMTAEAYHQLHLPVLVSGGRVSEQEPSLATLMKSALVDYFAVPVRWTEDRSQTTYENALYTAAILRKDEINSIVLVAQARDQPRAIWSFKRVGLRVQPWPAIRSPFSVNEVDDFLPNIAALNASFYALHELIGSAYYQARY